MLNRGVHPVFIPVENFVGDGIVNASEITFPKCIGIDQYRSTTNLDLTFTALEEIVKRFPVTPIGMKLTGIMTPAKSVM